MAKMSKIESSGFHRLNDSFKSGELTKTSIALYSQRWAAFCKYAIANGISRINKVTPELVVNYVRGLEVSASTQKAHLAALNCVLTKDSRSQWTPIKGSEIGIADRSQVRTEATPERAAFEAARDGIAEKSERGAAFVSLCREFGLRAKEAATLNPRTALRQAEQTGSIRVANGTKGGRVRSVPVHRQEQIEALRYAAAQQGREKSLIPRGLTFRQFVDSTGKQVRNELKAQGIPRIHDLRAAYACQRYQELTGKPAPVNNGGIRLADRATDHAARMTISEELGHGRMDVVASYVGSSK